ncbi:hypothetical protein [Ramlibacter sp. Leaf400]|uniref:hypothetical protein n=1 Tax=Ramlibacter sp. Leaf400 TaxID=1736365 RepID=UPI0006FCF45D|nr:hypothetical protein [Ramlibacter sp. Leaf400]KQT13642.1 hypothetical protein ASG30_19695 [Ramlibacter sp. Leaf400]
MDKNGSIRASLGPAPPVFPPAGPVPPLGLLLLDTAFPRPPGDLGRPDSWPRPVLTHVVPGAWPARVVQSAQGLRGEGLAQAFADGARSLQERGAAAITTSCGFLVLLQRELQAAVSVSLVTSSLLLLPDLLREEREVGVLTIASDRLGPEHLAAAGVPPERLDDVLVQGMPPDGPFSSAILNNRPGMDLAAAGEDVVNAARALRKRAPGLRTLVLECTNMPPYRADIESATGLRVLSLTEVLELRAPPPRQ